MKVKIVQPARLFSLWSILFLFSFLASNRTMYYIVNMSSYCCDFSSRYLFFLLGLPFFLLQYNINSELNFSPCHELVKSSPFSLTLYQGTENKPPSPPCLSLCVYRAFSHMYLLSTCCDVGSMC